MHIIIIKLPSIPSEHLSIEQLGLKSDQVFSNPHDPRNKIKFLSFSLAHDDIINDQFSFHSSL